MKNEHASPLTVLRELNDKLAGLRESCLSEEDKEGACTFEVLGRSVTTELFYHDRKQARRRVIIDGYDFAAEVERVPWNILKSPTTRYWVWTDLPLEKVQSLLRSITTDEPVEPMEEFYPSNTSNPRWDVSASNLEDVVRIWEVWAPIYRPK